MDTEALLRIGIDILRLVPLVLIFYVPALLGLAIFKERGEDYRVKSALMLSVGFAVILGVHLLIRTASVQQIIETIAVSAAQMAVALLLAAFTVYKLAD